jgi:DNA-binding transcriptional LysR family regulator
MGRAELDKEIEAGTLVAVPLKPALTRKLHLIYPQGRFRSRMASTFIEFAKMKFRELAA